VTGNETSSVLAALEASRRRQAIVDEAFRATLTGLVAVHVQVEPFNADAERDGLRRADLQADVESLLREAGMRVVSQAMLFATVPGTPLLHLDVMTVRLDGRYAYSVRLELWQSVQLVRDASITTLALTWSAPQLVGTVAAEHLDGVRGVVRNIVAGFLDDCQLATPGAGRIGGSSG
jgi:hypothetical protein